MHRKKLYQGLLCIVISFASFIAPANPVVHVILSGLSFLGVVYVGEYITRSWGNYSLTHDIRSSRRTFALFLLSTTVSGILLEGIFVWTTHHWFYPEWSTLAYALLFIPGFAAYWLAIVESYLAARTLLSKVVKSPRFVLVLLSVVVSFPFAAAVIEGQNVPAGLWRYTNWPLELGSIIGIPTTVFLMWPVHYFFILFVWSLFDSSKRKIFFS